MNYDVDELFKFEKIGGGYAIRDYLKSGDPSIAELEIPAEYKGEPVTCLHCCFIGAKHLIRVVVPPSVESIHYNTFYGCKSLETAELSEGLRGIGSHAFCRTNLKSIVLPKSLEHLDGEVFAGCTNLESVVFKSGNSAPSFWREGGDVFTDCHKLPADITLMGLVASCDISEPFSTEIFHAAFELESSERRGLNEHLKFTRPDVFDLAIKNDCFRSVDAFVMLRFLFIKGETERLRFAAENGLLKTRELADEWIERSAKEGLTELTAYLLELKKRKFGFNGGNDFEL